MPENPHCEESEPPFLPRTEDITMERCEDYLEIPFLVKLFRSVRGRYHILLGIIIEGTATSGLKQERTGNGQLQKE